MNLKFSAFLFLISLFVCSLSGTYNGSNSTLHRVKRSGQNTAISNIHSDAGKPILSPNIPSSNDDKIITPGKLPKEKSPTEILNELVRGILIPEFSRFEAKHLYLNGQVKDLNGKPLDSFLALSSDPDFAKKYLFRLDGKLCNGNILPQGSTENFDGWFEKIGKKIITIVDADIDVLTADIRKQFQDKVASLEKTKTGELTKKSKKILKDTNFLTTQKYTVTHISFHGDDSDPTKIQNVEVRAAQIETSVELGVEGSGKPSHFESLGSLEQQVVLQERKPITKFSKTELQNNADIKNEMWRNLGLLSNNPKNNKQTILLNENNPIYKFRERNAEQEFEKLSSDKLMGSEVSTDIPGVCNAKSRSGSCAIRKKPNGEIESIHPNEFIEQYKNAGETARQEMAELVKDNRDKVILPEAGGDDASRNMWNLVELEELKNRVSTVQTVDDIERPKRQSGGGDKVSSASLDDIEAKLGKIKTDVHLSQSKVSQRLSNIAQSKALATGVAIGSNAFGAFFLAKTVVNGIIHGDTTSLIVVGARVGYELVTESAVALGGKIFSTASKAGKATGYLGKAAGPIGAVADVGLSVWSMVKSIQRLNNATNKYERYDAIADIVTDAIDIAVTATVTGLSLAFPPAAPLIQAIGLVIDILVQLGVALFKAANEVNRINSQIPLLGFEKKEIFQSRFFDWFGTRKPDYIDTLLEEKAANDMAVQHNLRFLEQNQDFLGIVFPSRTMTYDGGCTLTNQYCALKNIWGCTRWEGKHVLGRGCDSGRPCPPTSSQVCSTYKSNYRSGFNQRRCECGRANTNFGNPRSDSMVDFRRKQTIYWERSVPSDVQNAAFKCKPGSLRNLGYTVSKGNSRSDYLCENAIGLLQPLNRRKAGQAMLFDLDDGNDRVYLGTESIPNVFRMGNGGNKEYHGGVGRNEFMFDSSCSKSLTGGFYGGRGEDGITLGDTCASGKDITVDLKQGRLTSTNGNNLAMRFTGIETVTGRERQADIVQVACSTRKVFGRGGRSGKIDQVNIPSDTGCQYNLTVFGAQYTKISSSATKGNIVILIDSPWTNLQVDVLAPLSSSMKPTVLFMKTTSSQISNLSFETLPASQNRLRLYSSQNWVDITFKPTTTVKSFPIYFTEGPTGSPNSILFFTGSNESAWTFYHYLPKLQGSLLRNGCKMVPNVFDIIGDNWVVIGGDRDDEFTLGTTRISIVDGGKGEDTLSFQQTFNQSMTVELSSSKVRRIENVRGVQGVPLTVRTACDTNVVATQGGSETVADSVIIPDITCTNRSMLIVASGNTKVVRETGNRSMTTNDVIQIVANGNNVSGLMFELEARSLQVTNLVVTVMVSHRNWSVTEAKKDTKKQIFQVQLEGMNGVNEKRERIKLILKDGVNATGPYLQSPYIQTSVENSTEITGTLLIERETGTPKMMFVVDDATSSTGSKAHGFLGMENLFQLIASDGVWEATGGNKSDLFIISTAEDGNPRYHINGYGGDDNTLLLESDQELKSVFLVNLARSELGYLHTPAGNRGKISNIQHIIGRVNSPDTIHPTCDTKTVDGRGGRCVGADNYDHIIIGDQKCGNITLNLLATIGKFTSVKNTARVGKFEYQVEDILTSSFQVLSTKDNTHVFDFRFHPWESIIAVAFNNTKHELAWRILEDQIERVQVFPLWKEGDSAEYTNPVFFFHSPGSSVSSDIRVSSDGVTMATYMVVGTDNPDQIKGLPVDVNRFLINVTSVSRSPKGGSIHGCSDGVRCSANQFWVFNLASPLDVLDGGACPHHGCINYLHFAQNSQGSVLHVDLDVEHGSITTDAGEMVISQLRNIHELHGTPDMTAHVTCNTSQVSNVDHVIVKHGTCPLNLIIGVQNNTKVTFDEVTDWGNLNVTQQALLNSTVHYRFANAMSFDPEGDFLSIISHSHNYYLPFKLDSLSNLHFDLDEDRLFYNLSGTEYNHSMLAAPGYFGQFYLQPNMVTEDGFHLQVARDGSFWATMGTTLDIPADAVPELQATANRLGITMILYTSTNFYFIGHSVDEHDRNVIQNIANFNSHLAGGGTNDTIYEIEFLDEDIFIYTGFTEEAPADWNGTKQTIDLTDIVVPIRLESETKYIPTISPEGDNLVITMAGYHDNFPGKVVIVGGAFPWVARRVQLLLSSSMMDLVPDEELDGRDNVTTTVKWTIRPRAVIVPENTTVFSVSLEDLENGQDVLLESSTRQQNNERRDEENVDPIYKAVRNGTDLYVTNIGSPNPQTDLKILVISDYFENPSLRNETRRMNRMPKTVSDVKINIPGLQLVLNWTDIMDAEMENGSSSEEAEVASMGWRQMLHDMEDMLLQDMPEISREYWCEECQPWWKRDITWLIAGATFIIILAISICFILFHRKLTEQLKFYFAAEINRDADGLNNPGYVKKP